MGWFDFLKEEEFALIKIIEVGVLSKNTHNQSLESEQGKLYFYLYESNKEKRKFESKCSINNSSNNFNSLNEYVLKIYPWLQGTNFDDIPSYIDATTLNKKKYVKQLYIALLK